MSRSLRGIPVLLFCDSFMYPFINSLNTGLKIANFAAWGEQRKTFPICIHPEKLYRRNRGKYQNTQALLTFLLFYPCSEDFYVLSTGLCLGDRDEDSRVPALGSPQSKGPNHLGD